jgi:hypothetical protein
MAANRSKRAECAIETIREQAELPPEAITALQEIFEVIGTLKTGCHCWKVRDVSIQRLRWACPIAVDPTDRRRR